MNLNTLIDDIYSKLYGLSEGKPLDIKPEELDKTLNGLREAILSWSQPSERNKNFTMRMSNIGKPARQLWYEKRDESSSNIPSASTQIKFLYGHILEEIALMLVRMSGHKVTDEQKEVSIGSLKGHMDCKIDGEVVDVKTASNFSFAKFAKGTLSEDDPFGYLPQLASYEKAEGTNNGGFLVINKESGELCLHQPEDLSKPNMEYYIDDKIKSVEGAEAPDLCYTPVPEGKKGNMRIAKGCVWCPYKFDCFKESNDGQGLRIFKYSNRNVYLTEVKDPPSVEELIYEQ
jgi:hypothetical protein